MRRPGHRNGVQNITESDNVEHSFSLAENGSQESSNRQCIHSESNRHISYHHRAHQINENPYSQKVSYSLKTTILSHICTSIIVATIVVILCRKDHSAISTTTFVKISQDINATARNIRRNEVIFDEDQTSSVLFYDVVVVGSGPAGLTASLFAARAGLHVLVIGSETGLLSEANSLDNFPSWYHDITYNKTFVSAARRDSGQDWLDITKKQASSSGVQFAIPGLLVSKITLSKNLLFAINVSKYVVHSLAVIISTGATSRKLNLPQEESLWGGGDSAIDAALMLSRYARKVIVVHRRTAFRASNKRNLEAMFLVPSIEVKIPFVASQYLMTDDKSLLIGVELLNSVTKAKEVLHCDGVFVMIGSVPNTAFLNGLINLNENGYIVQGDTDSTGTSMDGIFAAGEVIDSQYKQVITASSAGAMAAIDTERWLRQRVQINRLHSSKRLLPNSIPLQVYQTHVQQFETDVNAPNRKVAEISNAKFGLQECVNMAQQECIEELVHKHPVVVFSKSWCPYCKKALEALRLEGVTGEPYLYVKNLEDVNAPNIQSTLEVITGRRTVPNVFVGGVSIGGGDETVHMQQNGSLRLLLIKAKAIYEE